MNPPKDLFSAEDIRRAHSNTGAQDPRTEDTSAGVAWALNAIHPERCEYRKELEDLKNHFTENSLQGENARLRVDAKRFEKQAMACGDENAQLRKVLQLIAAPKRSDGTYNRSREACEQLASAALEGK